MRPLSGLDAAFLYSETPTTPMNVIATITLDPQDCGQPIDYESILQRLQERLPLLPQFRRTLVEMPFGLDHPTWVEAPEVDLQHHVMRVLAREPGGRAELAEVVAKAAAARLDRAHPLWSLWVVEGLEGGRLALVIRAHHALLDGMSGAALLLHLFDRDEESATEPSNDRRKARTEREGPAGKAAPSPLALLGRLVTGLPERADCLLGAVETAVESAVRIARKRLEPDWDGRRPAAPLCAPRTHFNRPVSAGRSVAYSRVPLAQVQKIRAAFGGTLNSVVLAGCAEALRRHLQGRGELPAEPLIAAVPVSTRGLGHEPGGNRISAMLVRLPVQLEDPVERLLEVRLESQIAKRFHAVMGGDVLAAVAELPLPWLTQKALQAYSRFGLADRHRPFSNVTISTVAGPRAKLSLAGATVQTMHPHGPLMEGSGLNITVMSYGGSIDVGVLACSAAFPDAREIADSVAGGIERLAKLTRRSLPELALLGHLADDAGAD